MKIIVLEDSKTDFENLENLLLRYEKENDLKFDVLHFNDPLLFLETDFNDADLLLFDIEMPGLNGIEVAKKVREINEDIPLLFITNMAQFALEGYKVNAIDYFIKPLNYFDLKMRLDKFLQTLGSRKKVLTLKVSADNGGFRMVRSDEILYIESSNHTMEFHLLNDNINSRSFSIKGLEKSLKDYGFFRCDACYLVNLKYCTGVKDNDAYIGKDILHISRNRKKDFIEALLKSMEAK